MQNSILLKFLGVAKAHPLPSVENELGWHANLFGITNPTIFGLVTSNLVSDEAKRHDRKIAETVACWS